MRCLLTGFSVLILASAAVAGTTVREVKTRNVAPAGALPADLLAPEGKTRWDLQSIAPGAALTIAIRNDDSAFFQETRADASTSPSRVTVSGADAERWLLPDHDPAQMKMGNRVSLQFAEARDGLTDRLSAEIQTVGIGWVHLPRGPEEVVLQRVSLWRQRAGERAMHPDLLMHRWVSPREGVLATIAGPVSADGRTRVSVSAVSVVESVLSGASTLKMYADQIYRGPFTDLKYGYDRRGASVSPYPVSSLVPDAGVANICDLVNLNTWNFLAQNSGQETATIETPVNSAETCNFNKCGYAGYPVTGGLQPVILERLDSNLTGTIRKDNQVVQRENRATDVTFWLRAGTQKENVPGAFGDGETRFCFTDEPSKPKNEVAVWQMTHNDAGGWYLQAGDSWTSDPIVAPACQESFSTGPCGSGGQVSYSRGGCSAGGRNLAGAQFSKVVKGGVVTLPSGHTLNAFVTRNTTEYCNYLISNCSFLVATVRTIVYYWTAPFVGSVALLRGPQQANFAAGEVGETPCTNFTTVEFTDIGYGLFPPVSITAGATTDTTVALSWNPGNDTHRLSGYKIYWDTDPGASTPYAFNSVANAGQVSIVGTTATISGLTPGTTYYFTVTSLSNFTDPSTSATTQYESIRYPTTVAGDPSFSYPVEVAGTTTGGACVPSVVTSMTVDKANPNVHVCWTPTGDLCTVGYDVLASDDATSDVGWSVVGSVGLTSCWDGNPSQKFLLVRARGTSSNGPWGHYSH